MIEQTMCANCGKPLSPVWKDKCHHCGAAMSMANPPRALDQPIIVRNYYGRSQADAAWWYGQEAESLGTQGYVPVSQSWADGRSGLGRIIMLGFIGALVWKPDGTLTVTYRKG